MNPRLPTCVFMMSFENRVAEELNVILDWDQPAFFRGPGGLAASAQGLQRPKDPLGSVTHPPLQPLEAPGVKSSRGRLPASLGLEFQAAGTSRKQDGTTEPSLLKGKQETPGVTTTAKIV